MKSTDILFTMKTMEPCYDGENACWGFDVVVKPTGYKIKIFGGSKEMAEQNATNLKRLFLVLERQELLRERRDL